MIEGLDLFRRDESGLSPAFFLTERARSVLHSHVEAIEAVTRESHHVSRICVFENSASLLQAMLVAQYRGMDSRPRVLTKPKLFMPLRGRLVLLRVDLSGVVVTRELLVPGQNILTYVEPRQPYIDLPVDEVTSHLEITLGPHDRISDRNFPPVLWDEGERARRRWREEQIRLALNDN